MHLRQAFQFFKVISSLQMIFHHYYHKLIYFLRTMTNVTIILGNYIYLFFFIEGLICAKLWN